MTSRKEIVPFKEAQGIARRLGDFIRERYDSAADFDRKLGVPRTTRTGWTNTRDPRVPEAAYLIKLAREAEIDLSWLLLGRGHPIRVEPTENASPEDLVSAIIKPELRHRVKASNEEFEAAWDRMNYSSDWSRREPQVLRSAVEGVRWRFEQMLQLVRHYMGMTHLVNDLNRQLYELRQLAPEKAKKADREARKLFGPSLLDVTVDQVSAATPKSRGRKK